MEYKTLKGVNQSILKKILIHPQEFLKAKARQENTRDSTESHFLFGSVVDIMLTGNKDEFDSKYTKVQFNTIKFKINNHDTTIYKLNIKFNNGVIKSCELNDTSIINTFKEQLNNTNNKTSSTGKIMLSNTYK